MKVQGLINSQTQSGAYALILSEEGPRRIPVIIGAHEAQAIAIALENLHPPRPLTHDLFAHFITACSVQLIEVLIYKFEDGIYYSEMLFTDGTNRIRIDARTSDAIAIALRLKCDIYIYESVLRDCGIAVDDVSDQPVEEMEPLIGRYLESGDSEVGAKLQAWLSLLKRREIEERIEKAVADENYEYARIYRDELRRRDAHPSETPDA